MTDPMHAFMNHKMPNDWMWLRRVKLMVLMAAVAFLGLVYGLEVVLKLF